MVEKFFRKLEIKNSMFQIINTATDSGGRRRNGARDNSSEMCQTKRKYIKKNLKQKRV